MHTEQRILQQRHAPQGNFTILPTAVVNLPTKTGSGWGWGVTPPNIPLAPSLCQVYEICFSAVHLVQKFF